MREFDRFFQVERPVEQRGIGRITLSNTREPVASLVDGERISRLIGFGVVKL